MVDNQAFWEWAEKERENRGLTWSRVERIGELSNAAISKRARDLMKPTDETCRAIARAFGISPDEVMRVAGLLPKSPGWSPELDEWVSSFVILSDNDREELLEVARLKAKRRERDKTRPGK